MESWVRGVNCNLCGSNKVYKKFTLQEFEVLKCKDCSLTFLSHIPGEDELKNFYSSDYYLKREEYYFNNIVASPEQGKRDENIETFSRGLKKLNSFKPEKGRILDVGCGPGIFLHMARTDGWDVSGIDISPYAINYAREKFGLDVHNDGQLRRVNFSPGSFEVITLWDSLEHLSDPLDQLKEAHRLLKDGGLIMLDLPNESSLLRVMAQLLYFITRGKFTYPVRKLYHRYHLYYFSLHAVQILLEMGGFEILSVERKTIPIVKARGSFPEKVLVKMFSYLERGLGKEYELLVIARKMSR